MDEKKVENTAVILNANARKVTRKIKRQTEQFIPKAQLYVSHSYDEARTAISDIVEKGYQTVFCGGGDGTLVNTITQFKEYIDQKNKEVQSAVAQYKFPTLGVLKLGTGNGISGMIGNPKGLSPLRSFNSGEKSSLMKLNLIESEKKQFHFAGLGWDAAIINDYHAMRERFSKVLVAGRLMEGFRGYIASMAVKTVPRELFRRRPPNVRVINEGDQVYNMRLNKPAELMQYKRGDTIYEGPVSVLGAGTSPFYGYNLVAFPFARLKEGYMNFRIINAGVVECVMRSPWIFRGRYQSKNFLDFLATKVRMEFDQPMPLHIGGDASGYRESITFSMSDLSVNILDYSRA